MSKSKDFRAKRQKAVTLRDGTVVTLRRPDLRHMFDMFGLEPAEIARVWAKPSDSSADLPPAERRKLADARFTDKTDLARAMICECALSPLFYMDRAEADENDGLCATDLDTEDLDRLSEATNELLGVTRRQMNALAPFPESADAGTAGQPLEHPPVEAAEESVGIGI